MSRPTMAAMIAIAATWIAACGSDGSSSGVGAPCTRTSDCQTGLSCGVDGVCTGKDSGMPADGGADAADAGVIDGRSAG